jgi:hypothetical protein
MDEFVFIMTRVELMACCMVIIYGLTALQKDWSGQSGIW